MKSILFNLLPIESVLIKNELYFFVSLLINEYPEIDFTNVDEIDTMWKHEREETIDELNERILELNKFLQSRTENEIAIVGHSSFIGQYKDKKIGLMENGDKELLHCYPYKVEFKL